MNQTNGDCSCKKGGEGKEMITAKRRGKMRLSCGKWIMFIIGKWVMFTIVYRIKKVEVELLTVALRTRAADAGCSVSSVVLRWAERRVYAVNAP